MLAKSTPYMIENLGGYGIYFVFASCVSLFVSSTRVVSSSQTTIGAIWQFFCMPETKGKSLEEIEALFGGSVPTAADRENVYYQDENKKEADHVESV